MSILKIHEAKKVDAKTNEILSAYLKKCTDNGSIRDGDNLREIDFDSKNKAGYFPRAHCINLTYAGVTISSANEPVKLVKSLAPNGKPIYVVLYRWAGIQGVTKPTNENIDPNMVDFNLVLRSVKPFLNFIKGLVDFLIKTWDQLLNLFGIGESHNEKDPITEAHVAESDLDKKISQIPKIHEPKKPKQKLPEDPTRLTDINQLTNIFVASSEKEAGLVILFFSKSQKWLQLCDNEDVSDNMQKYVPAEKKEDIPAATKFPGDVTHILIKWANSPRTGANKSPYTDESGALYGKITFFDHV